MKNSILSDNLKVVTTQNGDRPCYDEDLQREENAYINVKRLAAELAVAAIPIARIGDGNCGSVIQYVMDALIARGLYSDPANWTRVTPKKKVIKHDLRRRVFERNAYRCVHCTTHLDLCVDHIKPESKGGTLAFDNLQTLCRSCNSSKGAKE